MIFRILRVAAASTALFTPFLSAAQPWDSPFAADTHSILEAAGRILPAEHPEVSILLEDHRYSIHSDGRMTATIRKLYRVEQQDAVEDWSSVEQAYQPWYQQTPSLRARVIGKDGTTRWLDPKTIADAPARQFDSTIFSDERVIRAPLPGVEAGAVVEFEVVLTDKIPLLDAGAAYRVAVQEEMPIERFHVLIGAEPGVNLQIASKLIADSAIRRNISSTGSVIECELGPIPVRKHFEWNLPFDVTKSPYLAFSTGASWQSIAARYESIVEQKVQNADLQKFLDGVDFRFVQ
jgi:hypothetical protein